MLNKRKKTEAIEIFKQCGIENPKKTFGAQLDAKAENLTQLYNLTAASLHESWRHTYAKNNRDENGIILPRWKVIKDKSFIDQLDSNNLPSNIRKIDDKYEIDIANTKYESLSSDWQRENLEAAKIASGLAIISLTIRIDLRQIGHVIHEQWLNRNAWAKNDAVLGKNFDDLPLEEKDKDVVQFLIAKELFHEIILKDINLLER